MRDWILEMNAHTQGIQAAIDADEHDRSWRLIHEYQTWCYERINAHNYSLDYAGTLLSTPHLFFVRILKKEKRHKEMLVHLIFQAASDDRKLKSYPRDIGVCFRRCKFTETALATALTLVEKIQHEPFDGASQFLEIKSAVESWG